MTSPSQSGGFITELLIIIVALILLGYFRVNIQQVFSSPDVQANLLYAWHLLVSAVQEGWNYLSSLLQMVTR